MKERSLFLCLKEFKTNKVTALFITLIGLIFLAPENAGASLFLVQRGVPHAVVITAENPSPVAAFAAEELVKHVEMATGLTLEVITESQAGAHRYPVRIFLGATDTALERGINHEAGPRDAALLRVIGNDLFLLGNEDRGSPFGSRTPKGTMFAVYEVLERFLQVRWLWPGELGTYVPRTHTIAVDRRLNETIFPAFEFRRARTGHINRQVSNPDATLTRLGFSRDAARDYRDALRTFQARYRMGDTKPKPRVGHHFSGWWERHGRENPEWFMLNEEGRRGPLPGGSTSHVAVCVSNPGLHRYIIEEDWDGGDVLSLGEVDVRVFCHCDDCQAWDERQPRNPPAFARADYQPRMVSDRYARFWKTIYNHAVRRNPNVRVTTFLYWNYLPAPIGNIQLNENIYGEFVPWTGPYVYFPMPEERLRWKKQQWLGWRETGITIAYRPNHLHGGYVFPNFSTWQYGEFFKFGYENGMVGFDFDSLFGHWAVNGPMLYVQMRLFVDPTLSVRDIRRDYFSAFGPAGRQVERYFDYWEDHSGVRGGNPHDIISSYPERVFEQAAGYLDRAWRSVRRHDNQEYAQRIEFLQAGLEHARLAARFIRSTNGGNLPSGRGLQQVQQNLAELVAFRREHEHLFFADLVDAANRENRAVDMNRLLRGMQLP